MIKNVYMPSEEDILEWAFNPDPKWPESDWDYYVLRDQNDSLIVKLANDKNCPKRNFFLHALYYFIGDAFNNRTHVSEEKRARIRKLTSLVGESDSESLIIWKQRVEDLLSSKIEFDPEKWLYFTFDPW